MTNSLDRSSGASAETVAAARLLLAQMGISAADLVAGGPTAPTFGEIIPKVRPARADRFDSQCRRVGRGMVRFD